MVNDSSDPPVAPVGAGATSRADDIAGAALMLLVSGGASALSMGAVAAAAKVSRPTLYRYYADMDAVFMGVARVLSAHDDEFARHTRAQGPAESRLEFVLRSLAGGHGDDTPSLRDVVLSLPPQARSLLEDHESRIAGLIADILIEGIDSGVFSAQLDPSQDSHVLMHMVTGLSADISGRAVTHALHIVRNRE